MTQLRRLHSPLSIPSLAVLRTLQRFTPYLVPHFRFVFFKTQKAAALASQALIHGEDNREFLVVPAPGPEEVTMFTQSSASLVAALAFISGSFWTNLIRWSVRGPRLPLTSWCISFAGELELPVDELPRPGASRLARETAAHHRHHDPHAHVWGGTHAAVAAHVPLAPVSVECVNMVWEA